MTIGERLKILRTERNLTLEEVSKQLNFSRQTLQRYESGVITNIPSDKIEGLAKIYNVSPAYIMGWEVTTTEIVKEEASEYSIKTIAAHIDGEPLTDEELEDVLEFARFQLQKRKNKNK